MRYKTQSAVVFCIYNRPEHTRRVFEQIALARPPALYIVADGPRVDVAADLEHCQAARSITKEIDWPCEVIYDFADENLGCKQRIYTGLSKAFELFDFAIILEDDCLPSSDFFRFIDMARERHENAGDVVHISGTALVRPHATRQTYYRSELPVTWGWATWRRTWSGLDLEMADWPSLKDRLSKELNGSKTTVNRLIKHMEKSYVNSDHGKSIDTWDYPYFAHVLKMKGHCITPLYNLVSNIGFGQDSTHTDNSNSPQALIPLDELPQEIIHPQEQTIDSEYSSQQLDNLLYRPKKLARRFYRLCNLLGLPIRPSLARPTQ